MKVLDIALKDMLRQFRSAFAVVMMFITPLLITGILYFAFGSMGGDDGGFDLPTTRVQVVNLDQPGIEAGGFEAGQMFLQLLRSSVPPELLQVTVAANETLARTAVERQQAGVAIIIPPDFSAALTTPGQRAQVTLYQDPTLILGPGIVKDLVSQLVDGFAGSSIATGVVSEQFEARGLTADAEILQGVVTRYTAWAQSLAQTGEEGLHPALAIQSPREADDREEKTGEGDVILGSVMAGMLIFFTFFSGASTAESILREHEEGTLARLFTTPTSRGGILAGKFLAVFITLLVQVIVLLVASALVFGIRWGDPLAVGLVALGLIVSAAGLGVFLMSLLKSTRQSGPVMGGVLTITGMLGGLFTTGFENLPEAYDTVTLFTPHGWVLRGWKLALRGGGAGDVLLPSLVTLGAGVIFFAVGTLFFRRRFA
jgi:ABC-2 type transport system permease protein